MHFTNSLFIFTQWIYYLQNSSHLTYLSKSLLFTCYMFSSFPVRLHLVKRTMICHQSNRTHILMTFLTLWPKTQNCSPDKILIVKQITTLLSLKHINVNTEHPWRYLSILPELREKGRDLTHPYDKSPYPYRKNPKSNVTTQNIRKEWN